MRRAKGNIALEACLAVSVLVILVPFLVDAVRRAQYQAGLHRAAFMFARLRALGEPTIRAKAEAHRYLHIAFPKHAFEIDESVTGSGIWGRAHYRFPMLYGFSLGGVNRHHLEVTERCLFPY